MPNTNKTEPTAIATARKERNHWLADALLAETGRRGIGGGR